MVKERTDGFWVGPKRAVAPLRNRPARYVCDVVVAGAEVELTDPPVVVVPFVGVVVDPLVVVDDAVSCEVLVLCDDGAVMPVV